MNGVLAQLLAAVLLGGCIALGYRKWVTPRAATLSRNQRGALLLILLALTGGLLGSPFWWTDQALSFAWDLPPLASRMLASAGLSFFVVSLLALMRPSFRRVRLVMLLLFVYLAPLVVAIVSFHRDRFDPSAPITYSFLAVALLMTVTSTWYLLRPVTIISDTPADTEPSSTLVKAWLAAVALLTALWGLALITTDAGPSEAIWVWPGDLLTSRLIGVMLITIAAGAVYSLRHADVSRVMLAVILTYAFGLVSASLWNAIAGKPVKSAYVIVFSVIFIGSAGLLLWDRFARPAPTHDQTDA